MYLSAVETGVYKSPYLNTPVDWNYILNNSELKKQIKNIEDLIIVLNNPIYRKDA